MACATSPALYGQNLPAPLGEDSKVSLPRLRGRAGWGRLFDQVGEAAPVRHVVRVELIEEAGWIVLITTRRGRARAGVAAGRERSVGQVAAVEVDLRRDHFAGDGVHRRARGLERHDRPV